MFILFALVFMRMSGAVVFNPILGRSNLPNTAKGMLIFVLSLMLYMGQGGSLAHQPSSMIEFGVMLVMELLLGFVMGFSMELSFMVVRFASAVVDYTMGLSMAQVYDPQYNTQMTVTSGVFYAFMALLFLAVDGHIRIIALFFCLGQVNPFRGGGFSPGAFPDGVGAFSGQYHFGAAVRFSPGSYGTGYRGCRGDPDAHDPSDQCVCREFPIENHRRPDDAGLPV